MSKKLIESRLPAGHVPISTAGLLLVPFLFILTACSLYLPEFDNPFDPESPIYAVHTPPTILAPAAGHQFTTGFTLVWKKAGTVADTYRLQVASDQDFRPGSVVLDVELTDVDRYTVSSVPFNGPVYCHLAIKVERQGQTWSPWSTPLRLVKTVPIGNQAPTVSMVTSDPLAATEGQTVTISTSGTDPDGDAVVYRWYVDGVLQSCRSADFDFAVPGSATEQTYIVGVEAWDGALASNRVEITVEAEAGGTVSYSIGDFGPAGGIVFYENPNYAVDGWRWLEAWTADEPGPYYQWKTTNTATPGTSTIVGSGYINTYTAMVGTEHPATEIARIASYGGYADWFLPSKDELNLMYGQRGVIGGFAFDGYWSSSEVNNIYSWLQYFDYGSQGGSLKDGDYVRVRVVRVFWDGDLSQEYSLYYDANGASAGTVPMQTASVASTSLPVPVQGNLRGPAIMDDITQRFTGWNTQPDGSGSNYQPMDTLIMPASNLTLYAQWTDDGGVIGKIGQAGGLVFYENSNYSEDGWRWLEAAHEDINIAGNVFFNWGGDGILVGAAAQGTAIGTGAFNTAAIVAIYGDNEPYQGRSDYAAKLCSNLVLGGYDDWFLPSKDELYLLYQNLHQQSYGDFASTYYSSSSEIDSLGTWSQHFDTDVQMYFIKENSVRIRAVRAFGGSESQYQYELIYEANNATSGNPPAGETHTAGTLVTIPGAGSLELAGYTFAGWNTQPDGSGTSYAPGTSYTMPNSHLVLYAQFQPEGEWASILFDDFEDGDYTNTVAWQSESLDSYYISVQNVSDNMMLSIPRGSDYGWATTAVPVGSQDFRISWDFQRFGDSLGRPWITLYDDSGKEAFQAYANSYNGGLTIYAYRYDTSGNPLTSDIIAQEPYSDATGVHHFAFVRAGNSYEFHIDGVLGAYGMYDNITSWNDNLVELGLFGHGSGPSSGAYYDNIQVEVKPSGIPGGQGDLSVTITAIMPGNQTVNFAGTTPALAFGTSMTVIAATPATPDAAFQWWLDGSSIPDAITNTVTVGSGLNSGSHFLVLFFRIEGTWYSETVYFDVLAGD